MFELDHETFTFSLNSGLKVYLQRNNQSKIELNAQLFQEMMQTGSYFLHLKEFAETMRNSGNLSDDGPQAGKTLQSFALAVGEFLSQYQATIIDFMNRVRRRRLAEAVLIFDDSAANDELLLSQDATLLEVQVHLEPLMHQLRLLANICFT